MSTKYKNNYSYFLQASQKQIQYLIHLLLYFASLYGRGDSLQLKVDCPKYSSEIADDVKYIDASAVLNKEKNEVSFFIVNRSENDNCNIDFDLKDFNVDSIIDQQIINNEV